MDSTKAVHALGALAHETRLAIFRMLVERGPDGLPAGVIAERLGLPPSSLSFHIQHLHRAGLITQRRLSRQLIYAADFASMNALVGFLTENCCGQGRAACLPYDAEAKAASKNGCGCAPEPETTPVAGCCGTKKEVAA